MADQPKTLDEVELPDTKPYRVAMLGASYNRAVAVYGPEGPMMQWTNDVGRRGEVIELDEAQARRLLDLGAVKETDDSRSYDEMSYDEVKQRARAQGVQVHSTSLAADMPLKSDFVDALMAYDAGAASIAPIQQGPLAVPSPEPDPTQNPGPGGSAPAVADDGDTSEKVRNAPEATGANVNELGAYLKSAKPNADETVQIAGGTPEGARAVLEAEELVTGGDPRATVVKRLQAIIDGGEA